MADYVYLDLEYLRSIVQGDRALMQVIVDKFLAFTPEMIAEVKQSLAAEDYEAFEWRLHKLKGSVGSIGLVPTHRRITKLQGMVKNQGDKSQIPSMTAQVITEIEGAMAEMEQEFK